MRILHELNQMEMGGAERVVLGIVKHDKANEHTVYTYKDGPMSALLRAAGARVIVNEGNAPRENVEVDLIHIHTGGNESSIAAAVKGVIPTVETIHSPVVSRVRDAWVTQRVGVTNHVTSKNRKCLTIYNGVDLKRLENELTPEEAKAKLGIPEDAFVVGRLGRIGTDKGLEEFLAACWHLQMKIGDRLYVLICGGEAKSSPGYLAKVKVMAASLPIKNVKFIAETDDVAPLYTAMDCFMYPSKTEGFGLVYVEAMACGVPVVAWKGPVADEILMGAALIVQPGVKTLTDAAFGIFQSGALKHALGQEGQRTAVHYFDEARMSRDYQDLYRRIPQPQGLEDLKEPVEEVAAA